MKAANIGLWGTLAILAWLGWIALDMARPVAAGGSSSASLSEIQTSTQPVLVEFYANWCGPCRAVGPIVEELKDEMAGRAKVIRINVDLEPQLSAEHGIRSIPTFIVFKDGREKGRQSGAISKAAMISMIGL